MNSDFALIVEYDEQLAPVVAKKSANDEIYVLPSLFRKKFDEAAKYLLFKGGRGSGKTLSIVAYLIEESYKAKYKDSVFLFIREIAVSISDSVYSVVDDLIKQAGLENDFKVLRSSIVNIKTGVKFLFTGLRATGGKTAFSTVNKIKGKHKILKIFGEESQDLSDDSINVLFPTVNRGGKITLVNEWREDADTLVEAQFLFAMNPNLDHDPIVSKLDTMSDAVIEHVNIFDLEPEFQDPQLLQQAKDEENEIYYEHVWLGAASYKIDGFPFAAVQKVNYGKIPKAHTCFVDPSFKGGDYTAITFLGLIEGQLCVWGYCWRLGWVRCLDDIARLCRLHECENNFYEENALDIVPKELLAEMGIDFVGHYTLGNKENRIYKVAAYVAHRTKILSNHSNTAYVTNVLQYQDGCENDDGADSLASCMIKAGIISEKMKF